MSTFGADENQATLICASSEEAHDEIVRLPKIGKVVLAKEILKMIADHFMRHGTAIAPERP
jgi:hypothetical protein